MLFNSYPFLFAFLPLCLVGYFVATKLSPTAAAAWLVLCSLGFYGYWNPAFLLLIVLSVAFNYAIGRLMSRAASPGGKSVLFVTGIAANIGLLGVFKYLGPSLHFFVEHGVIGNWWDLSIILPLGISFFTFTQIGYLVDRRDRLAEDLGLLRYSLFVIFFPHLIAGPIIHVREIGPQLTAAATYRLRAEKFAPGLALFAIGLAKKVLLADPLSGFVGAGFSHPGALTLLTGWAVALAYAVQLYFDFSGYSDMAIGLAGMFGLRFPINFDSPLRSRSIIEFWQRWHMTLTRYLRLLLYNPIAIRIARRRVARGLKVSDSALAKPSVFAVMVALPTFVTMGLAGVWHGAGLQFAVFGLLHAAYLTVNQAWRIFYVHWQHTSMPARERPLSMVWQVGLTLVAVLVSFVFFRADSCATAVRVLGSMVGVNGFRLPDQLAPELARFGDAGRFVIAHLLAPDTLAIAKPENLLRILLSFAIVWAVPNSQQIIGKFAPILENPSPGGRTELQWRPNMVWALIIGVLLWASVMSLGQSTVFLYFQF
jgi:alginate O-acetyltransferase complex protein AlgI